MPWRLRTLVLVYESAKAPFIKQISLLGTSDLDQIGILGFESLIPFSFVSS